MHFAGEENRGPKARNHTSLGQRPRIRGEKGQRAESPIHARKRVRWDNFQPSAFSTSATQGVALGWYGVGPLALRGCSAKVHDRL